jgi:hypothetical protein
MRFSFARYILRISYTRYHSSKLIFRIRHSHVFLSYSHTTLLRRVAYPETAVFLSVKYCEHHCSYVGFPCKIIQMSQHICTQILSCMLICFGPFSVLELDNMTLITSSVIALPVYHNYIQLNSWSVVASMIMWCIMNLILSRAYQPNVLFH